MTTLAEIMRVGVGARRGLAQLRVDAEAALFAARFEALAGADLGAVNWAAVSVDRVGILLTEDADVGENDSGLVIVFNVRLDECEPGARLCARIAYKLRDSYPGVEVTAEW